MFYRNMQLIVTLVCLTTSVVRANLAMGTTIFCDRRLIAMGWTKCLKTYAPDELDASMEPIDSCADIECHIKCMEDAVGECINSDAFTNHLYQYDAEKYKVLFRAECSNREMYQASSEYLLDCPSNQTCAEDSSDAEVSRKLREYLHNGQYQEYKTTICSVYQKTRDCATILPSGNCTKDKSAYFTDLAKIQTSLSICENADIRELYNKFSGAPQCNSPKIDTRCFASSLLSQASGCSALPVRMLADHPEPMIENYCKNVECNIRCHVEAVGDCSKEEESFYLDARIIKVASRAACNDSKALISAIRHCRLKDRTCHSVVEAAISTARLYLDENNDSTAYRERICSAETEFKDCLDYVVDGQCTAELAKLLKDIHEVSHSPAFCGPQNHHYFTKYENDIQCSGSTVVSSLYIFMILVLSSILI